MESALICHLSLSITSKSHARTHTEQERLPGWSSASITLFPILPRRWMLVLWPARVGRVETGLATSERPLQSAVSAVAVSPSPLFRHFSPAPPPSCPLPPSVLVLVRPVSQRKEDECEEKDIWRRKGRGRSRVEEQKDVEKMKR